MIKKNTGEDHYDIYEYKGWTLREWQQPKHVDAWDDKKRKWIKEIIGITTHIVWGIHKPCGLRGIIMLTSGKVFCKHCEEVMPSDVYVNMADAMGFMRDALE